MTARQQLARLIPLALLAVLAILGLRGAVSAPRWNGPLHASAVPIGIALEVVLGAALLNTLRRDRAAKRAAETRPWHQDDEIGVPAALRFTLRWVLSLGMIAVAVLLITGLRVHFSIKVPPLRLPRTKLTPRPTVSPPAGHSSSFHVPVGPILYGLLVLVLVAAVAISLMWAARLRRPAAPAAAGAELDAEELREAVESGREALAELDDARAAIIACYLAMERSLADRGTARGVADTPDELLGRAVSAGIVHGTAARRLTGLFYEARFSSHPLGRPQRDEAGAALDEIAAELAASAAQAPAEPTGAPGAPEAPEAPEAPGPSDGGGWLTR